MQFSALLAFVLAAATTALATPMAEPRQGGPCIGTCPAEGYYKTPLASSVIKNNTITCTYGACAAPPLEICSVAWEETCHYSLTTGALKSGSSSDCPSSILCGAQ